MIPFFGCPHLGEADFVDLEVLIYFLQCASFGGVDLFDPEARIFLQCASFSGVDHFDPEAPVYFLQCASFSGVDHFDPEAPVYFCSALPSVGSITLTLRHQFIFCSGSLSDI